MVKTWPSHAGGEGLIPAQGVRAPHASWLKNQSIKNRGDIVKNSMKSFKKWSTSKIEILKIVKRAGFYTGSERGEKQSRRLSFICRVRFREEMMTGRVCGAQYPGPWLRHILSPSFQLQEENRHGKMTKADPRLPPRGKQLRGGI